MLLCSVGDAYDSSRALLLGALLPETAALGCFVTLASRDELMVLPVSTEALEQYRKLAKIEEAEDFLLRVRSLLHLEAKRNQNQLTQRRPTKFGYLLDQHRVTQDELNAANAEARAKQTDVETILVEQYKVPKGEMGAALSMYYRVPYQDFDERIVPPPDLMASLKIDYLKRNFWIPLKRRLTPLAISTPRRKGT